MTGVDASTRGRRNRANGAEAERKVARYLRAWFPDAERAEKNGWRAGERVSADPGDLWNAGPGLFWSVKNVQREAIAAWMAELDEKRAGRLGLLVVRRKGHASPGEWWCWLRAGDLLELAFGRPAEPGLDTGWPVRVELQHVMPLLVQAGYAPAPKAVA